MHEVEAYSQPNISCLDSGVWNSPMGYSTHTMGAPSKAEYTLLNKSAAILKSAWEVFMFRSANTMVTLKLEINIFASTKFTRVFNEKAHTLKNRGASGWYNKFVTANNAYIKSINMTDICFTQHTIHSTSSVVFILRSKSVINICRSKLILCKNHWFSDWRACSIHTVNPSSSAWALYLFQPLTMVTVSD